MAPAQESDTSSRRPPPEAHPTTAVQPRRGLSLPRKRRDSPTLVALAAALDVVAPQTRVIGRTFEFTFTLPKPENVGNTTKRKSKRTPKQPHTGSSSPARADGGNSTQKPTKPESDGEAPLQQSLPLGNVAKREASVPQIKPVAIQSRPRARGSVRKPATKAARTPLTVEEKRERGRKRANERRQRQKENGLCVSCPNQPIAGQTRCPECAERHRQSWKPEYRKTRN